MSNSLDLRVIHVSRTFADIAGLPLESDEAMDTVALQKLQTRVPQHFGDAKYEVIPPTLLPYVSGKWRFPRYEIMACAYEPRKVIIF